MRYKKQTGEEVAMHVTGVGHCSDEKQGRPLKSGGDKEGIPIETQLSRQHDFTLLASGITKE